jgi:hypothetical protein
MRLFKPSTHAVWIEAGVSSLPPAPKRGVLVNFIHQRLQPFGSGSQREKRTADFACAKNRRRWPI